MNDAHLHMVVNHFPIIGTIFGLGILIIGLVLKNNNVKNTAYVLFIIAAIFSAISMRTGEGAEEIAEKLPGVTEQIIEEHEELAEKFSIILYAIGSLSLISLFFSITKNALGKYSAIITVILAAIGVFLAKEVGTSGGEIRHTEIRQGNQNSAIENHSEEDDD